MVDRFGELTKINHGQIIEKYLDDDNHDIGIIISNKEQLFSVLDSISITDSQIQKYKEISK